MPLALRALIRGPTHWRSLLHVRKTMGMRRRAAFVLFAFLTNGCVSSGTAPVSPTNFVAEDGQITLTDREDTALPVTPDSLVTFITEHGMTPSVEASKLCRIPGAFAVKTGATCEGATPLAPYAEITSVEVETTDRAGTTVIVSAIVGVVIAVVAIVVGSKGSSGGGGGGGGGGSSAGLPPFRFRSGASPSLPAWNGPIVSLDVRGAALVARGALPERPELTPLSEVGYAKDGPVFTDREVRRSNVSALVAVDATGSAFSPEGKGGGAKGGVRLYDFVDLAVGARVFEGGRSVDGPRAIPTLTVGLHGEFPRARNVALGLVLEGGLGSAVNLSFDARFGLRFSPLRGMWIGLYPIHPAYIDWSKGRGDHWTAQSSLDLAYTF